MELKEFVKTTILELHEAISDIMEKSGVEYVFGGKRDTPDARGGTIEFDVAVEASEKRGGGGGVSVRVPMIRTGAELSKSAESLSSYTSRIQFELMIRKDGHKISEKGRSARERNIPKSPLVHG